jgi:glutathione synthase/RimK-type ligase-like ATP-grasp enzyme
MDVALATCAELPDLDPDDRFLVGALEARGLGVGPVVWDDTSVDWAEVRFCLIRSVWDYHLRRDEFLAWLDSLPPPVEVWNPPDVIRWNSHKGYLDELEAKGVPIVPTEWFSQGTRPDLSAVVTSRGWSDVVVKPVVSAGARDTALFQAADIGSGQKHLDAVLADGDAMAQPFLDGVHHHGERCIVVIDGEITHAVRKTTVFDPAFEDRPPRIEVADDEARLAKAAIEAAGFQYLYARVDMVRDEDDVPRLMELEMFEPSLYFGEHPAAAERLADRIAALLER